MDMVKLTPRLQGVADCIKKCNLLADVGTDHAYIPIYAIQNNLANNAIAGDVVKGPLSIATENIVSHGLGEKITPVLANGLDAAKNANVIVIAGMGGKLICEIIGNNLKIAKSADYMILQPMTCSYELRSFLHENCFEITNEKLAKEEDKIYNIMVVKKGKEKYNDEFYYHIGKKLFENNDKLLSEYIKMRAEVLKKQFKGMKNSKDLDLHQKATELESLYKRFIKEEKKYGEGN